VRWAVLSTPTDLFLARVISTAMVATMTTSGSSSRWRHQNHQPQQSSPQREVQQLVVVVVVVVVVLVVVLVLVLELLVSLHQQDTKEPTHKFFYQAIERFKCGV
jgi:heme/copper-type cytochrome/quinol oxidase subunit 2